MYSNQGLWPKWPSNIPCGKNPMEYRGVMHLVIEGIKEENLKMIMYLCQDIAPQNQHFNSFLDFINHLERCHKVNKDNISLLAEILYRINRIDLLKKIIKPLNKAKFEEQYLSQGWTHFTPFRILMFELTDDLGKADFDCLKHQFSDHMKQRQLDEATDVISLLTKLEELGVVDEDDYNKLIDVLGIIPNPEPCRKFQRLLQQDYSVYIPERFQKAMVSHGAIPFNTDNPVHFNEKKFGPGKGFVNDENNEPGKKGGTSVPYRYQFPDLQNPSEEMDSHKDKAFAKANPTQNEVDLHNKHRSLSNAAQEEGSYFDTYTQPGFDHNPHHAYNNHHHPYNPHQAYIPHHAQNLHHPPLPHSHSFDETPFQQQRNNYYVVPSQGYYNPKEFNNTPMNMRPQHYSDSSLPTYSRNEGFQHNFYAQQQQEYRQMNMQLQRGHPGLNLQRISPPPFQTSQVTQQQTANLGHEMNVLSLRTEEDHGSYKMTRKPTGLCILINNEKFEKHRNMEDYNINVQDPNKKSECPRIDLTDRAGSAIDAEAITEVFEGFSFIVKRYDDMKFHDMQARLQEYSTMDHAQFDCFVLVVLSHGKRNIVYSIDGYKMRISDMQEMFTSTKCPSLQNKPKLFFIQACGGNNKMEGREVKCQQVSDIRADGDDLGGGTPNVADFLLANSTVPGFVSYRSTSKGSWFISALVNNLKKYSNKEDLLSIIVRTNDEVSKNLYFQIPMPCITLRKKVYFKMTPEYEERVKRELNINPLTTVAMVEGASP